LKWAILIQHPANAYLGKSKRKNIAMGLFDRIRRVASANLNDLVSKAEDPEKMLEQAILEMQEDLVQLRQGVAQAIAAQKRTEQQYNQAQNDANKWQRNAQLALQKGDENLARQALERKKSSAETANTLKANLDQQSGQTDTLKRSLIALESKISEAKTKKDMLKARISAAKAQEQLQSTVGRIGTSSAMAAFERMEEKVLIQEARAQSAGELVGADLESQFAALESGSDVDDELAALKAQMSLGPGTPQNQTSLPQAGQSTGSKSNQVVDSDLEQLKKQLDQM
jgi:phage shock protein A